MPERKSPAVDSSSRRDFLKLSTAAAVGGVWAGGLPIARAAHAGGSDVLRVGLVGCGGRGTGAAADALRADPNVQLTALADAFADRVESKLAELQKAFPPERIDVPAERQFVGFDAYKQLLASDVDVVILATPPHFRPEHLRATVEAGKHSFVEKPVAVDGPGIRSVLASAELARQKNLAMVSGLCYRYDLPKRETIQRIHDGAIGDVVAMYVTYNGGGVWGPYDRQPEWSDMEWQMRNWYYFTWLSGDHNVEQHVHSLDKAAWVMHDETPLSCAGMGGRQVRNDPRYGNIFDHHAVVYEYASGPRLFSYTRQMPGCHTEVTDHIMGAKGSAELMSHTIRSGDDKWRYRGQSPSMYQQEHDEMFASIRAGSPINNGVYMSHSSLMAIMGRMATYTGQIVTWDQALASEERLGPSTYEWGTIDVPPVAVPGHTPLV